MKNQIPFLSLHKMHQQVEAEIRNAFNDVFESNQYILGKKVADFVLYKSRIKFFTTPKQSIVSSSLISIFGYSLLSATNVFFRLLYRFTV